MELECKPECAIQVQRSARHSAAGERDWHPLSALGRNSHGVAGRVRPPPHHGGNGQIWTGWKLTVTRT